MGRLAGCWYVTRLRARPKVYTSRKSEQQHHQTIDLTLHHTLLLQEIITTSSKKVEKYPEQYLFINNQPDANVRQAQPIPWPLAYTRRCAVQITCALSNTSRRLTLPLSLTQQRPSNRQWQTRQPQSQSFALTQQLAPSIRPPIQPRPPTAQRQNRHRKTHKERQRGSPARDLR